MMNLLWLGILASLVSSGLYLLRTFGLKRYIVESPPVEAMEYADYTVKPHPIYSRTWLLIVSFALSIIAAIFAFPGWNTPSVIALIVAIVAFFAYDLPGASILTKMIILPDSLLFENLKGPGICFQLKTSEVTKIVRTGSGFYIELHKPSLGNRLPIRTTHGEEILAKIADTTEIEIKS